MCKMFMFVFSCGMFGFLTSCHENGLTGSGGVYSALHFLSKLRKD